MTQTIKFDLCIIGAGSGGLSLASGAAQLGLNTVLIERGAMGGDCLNTGCVPSKALLAAAKRAHHHRQTDMPGIEGHEPNIDFIAVKSHITNVIQTIEPHDSQERFEGLGVTVIRDHAQFLNAKTVQAGQTMIKAKKFVIAAGSRPFTPPIKGLNTDTVLTNETIFDLTDKPDHLVIIGGGPIGMEMAQAHRRLGCNVTILDKGPILPQDDPDNVEFIRQQFKQENIDIYEHFDIEAIEDDVKIIGTCNGQSIIISGSHILCATGRTANIDGLGLENTKIQYSAKGIEVDQYLRTAEKHIYAIGDIVAGGPKFTHVAGYHASRLIQSICFKIPAKVDYKALPWVTYTDPEIAQVGLTAVQAQEQCGDTIQILEIPYKQNDRAIATNQTAGRIIVVADKKNHVLGASIVGPDAGELISTWGLAISSNIKIKQMASSIIPYPTLNELNKQVAGSFYTPRLFSQRTKRIVRFLQKLPI